MFFSLAIHRQNTLQDWNFQCKPVGLPTKCSRKHLVKNKEEKASYDHRQDHY